MVSPVNLLFLSAPRVWGALQVNYLGHWLLAHQLLTGQHRLRSKASKHNSIANRKARSAAAASPVRGQHQQQQQQDLPGQDEDREGQPSGTRIVMLSSMTHTAGRIKFDDLQATKSYSGFHRYADSKLAELLAVRSFTQRMNRWLSTICTTSYLSVTPATAPNFWLCLRSWPGAECECIRCNSEMRCIEFIPLTHSAAFCLKCTAMCLHLQPCACTYNHVPALTALLLQTAGRRIVRALRIPSAQSILASSRHAWPRNGCTMAAL